MSPPVAAPAWAPELRMYDEYVQEFPVNDSVSYYPRMEFDERHRLVEWAVTATYNGRRVVVYDVCHGKGYHVHYYDEDGTEIRQVSLGPVDSYKDMEACLDDAIQRVVQRWAKNEGRCDK